MYVLCTKCTYVLAKVLFRMARGEQELISMYALKQFETNHLSVFLKSHLILMAANTLNY